MCVCVFCWSAVPIPVDCIFIFITSSTSSTLLTEDLQLSRLSSILQWENPPIDEKIPIETSIFSPVIVQPRRHGRRLSPTHGRLPWRSRSLLHSWGKKAGCSEHWARNICMYVYVYYIWYNIILCHVMLCCVILNYAMLYYTILCYIALHCITLYHMLYAICYIVLYYIILYCLILCYIIL